MVGVAGGRVEQHKELRRYKTKHSLLLLLILVQLFPNTEGKFKWAQSPDKSRRLDTPSIVYKYVIHI